MKKYIKATIDSDAQTRYQSDFALFCQAVQQEAADKFVVKCECIPKQLEDRYGAQGYFRTVLINTEGEYSDMHVRDTLGFAMDMNGNEIFVHAEGNYICKLRWTPETTEDEILDKATEIVAYYEQRAAELRNIAARWDDYYDTMTEIQSQLESAFPALEFEAQLLSDARHGYLRIYKDGKLIPPLEISDVFNTDINKLIRSVRGKLNRGITW